MRDQLQYNEHLVELYEGTGSGHDQFERQLLQSGIPVPLPHRLAWVEARQPGRSLFIQVRDSSGRPRCLFAVAISRSRALPGHLILRLERFGPAASSTAREAGLRALAAYATEHMRILRVHIETFSPEAATRDEIKQIVTALGFKNNPMPRLYTETIAVDLRPDEPTIFAGLHATARRHIRAITKHPVELRLITEATYAQRMVTLLYETMKRTGGQLQKYDWSKIIKLSRDYPQLSRITGVFRADVGDPDALLAFAWGRFHGDHAEYAVAASTRTREINMPLGYAPAWDLILWAKRNGATWFDFGGIPSATAISNDAIAGISDFKRYFSRQQITVGEEWVLEPHHLRARLAGAVSAGARWLRRLARQAYS